MTMDFKSVFKYYKRKQPPPSLDEVIDTEDEQWCDLLEKCDLVTSPGLIPADCHTNDVSEWAAFKLRSSPGLTLIKNVFSDCDQLHWAGQCLKVESPAVLDCEDVCQVSGCNLNT